MAEPRRAAFPAGPEKRSLEAFTERLGLGAVYQTTEGSRYTVTGYEKAKMLVKVRYAGPSRGNTSEFVVPLARLLDEARDGVVWMIPSGVGADALAKDVAEAREPALGALHHSSGNIIAKLPIGPCPACGSDNVNPVTVAGYGQVWICEGCDRQVPVPTLPAGVLGEVVDR